MYGLALHDKATLAAGTDQATADDAGSELDLSLCDLISRPEIFGLWLSLQLSRDLGTVSGRPLTTGLSGRACCRAWHW